MKKFQTQEILGWKLKILKTFGISLSRRELECFYLLAYEGSIKNIARVLELSPRTIEMYINQIKNKTGIFYKSELTKKAVELLLEKS